MYYNQTQTEEGLDKEYLLFHEKYFKPGKNGGWRDMFLSNSEIRFKSNNPLRAFFPPQKPGLIEFAWINTRDEPIDPGFQIVVLKASPLEYLAAMTIARPYWTTFLLSTIGLSICLICIGAAALLFISYKKEKKIDLEEPLIVQEHGEQSKRKV